MICFSSVSLCAAGQLVLAMHIFPLQWELKFFHKTFRLFVYAHICLMGKNTCMMSDQGLQNVMPQPTVRTCNCSVFI